MSVQYFRAKDSRHWNIRGVKWTGDNLPEVLRFIRPEGTAIFDGENLTIEDDGFKYRVTAGQWILRDGMETIRILAEPEFFPNYELASPEDLA